jgi:hypothetical protein
MKGIYMTDNKENGFGLAGGISGIVLAATSFVFSWFLAPLYVIGCVAAIVLSAIGLKKSLSAGTKKGMAITGLATAIPTLLWTAIWSLALGAAVVNS